MREYSSDIWEFILDRGKEEVSKDFFEEVKLEFDIWRMSEVRVVIRVGG